MIEKLNSVHSNVWAIAVLVLGVVAAGVCLAFKQPIEPATMLIGGGLTLLKTSSTEKAS